jgi:diphosphomevalonate decarboxylase
VETFGNIAENEALTLHAMMMASNPSYMLIEPNTVEMIKRIRAYRAETKEPLYFSLDAGPNINLLYPEEIIHNVVPFVESQLLPLCQDGKMIQDWVGEGPVQV